MKKLLIIMFISIVSAVALTAQQIVVKHNPVGDIMLSPNLSTEVGLGDNTTAELYAAFNPFGSDNNRFKHWFIQPEFRYWLGNRFEGIFLGVHGAIGEFSVAGGNWPLPFSTFDNNRYEGSFYGGGVSIGHLWKLNDRWNLEATAGMGYIYFDYDKYKCTNCSPKEKSGGWNYVGPTKAAISLIYIIK